MHSQYHPALALGEMSMFENVTESRDPEAMETAEREEIAASWSQTETRTDEKKVGG